MNDKRETGESPPISNKVLILKRAQIYHIGVWLRNTLWDMRLPIEVSITIKPRKKGIDPL